MTAGIGLSGAGCTTAVTLSQLVQSSSENDNDRVPRVLVTDKLRSYAAANRDLGLDLDHRQHKGLNNRAENSHQPTRVRGKVMRRFKSARHLQRFASTHDQVANLFMRSRYNRDAAAKRDERTQAFVAWDGASGARSFGFAVM